MANFAEKPSVDMRALQKVAGGSLFWVALAFFLVMFLIFNIVRYDRVTGEEVGMLLNRLDGKVQIIERSGVKMYCGLTHDFYVLDKTLQTLEMTEVTSRGDRAGKDDLKIKTSDGSDVYVDLIVQYRLNPEFAKEVVLTSGPGDFYKRKWARDYTRSICRNYLGELTTEEFYDSSKRDAKLTLALNDCNKKLEPFGLQVTSIVIPQKPHFYKEYEEMIKRKKLADQAVLEEKSKALAAKQRQETAIVQETNRKNVAVEQFSGKMEQKLIEAKASAEQLKQQTDAYYDKVTIGAEASFYENQQQAEAILAEKTKQAQGIEELKKALEGEGGRNMVKLEYAKRLRNVIITGKPFTLENRTNRFEHSTAPAASNPVRQVNAQK